MEPSIVQQIAALGRMKVGELRSKHLEVFGESTRSGNREHLLKRIAWRIQANAWGDLSCRAKQRAEELANDANLRTSQPKTTVPDALSGITKTVPVAFSDHDPRLPMPGALLRRQYKGREYVIRVLPKGFEWEGQVYRSLSGLAYAITGTHLNGYGFFNLNKNGDTDDQIGQ